MTTICETDQHNNDSVRTHTLENHNERHQFQQMMNHNQHQFQQIMNHNQHFRYKKYISNLS